LRNKIRRQLEEIVRLSFDQMEIGFDVVILVEKEIINKVFNPTTIQNVMTKKQISQNLKHSYKRFMLMKKLSITL